MCKPKVSIVIPTIGRIEELKSLFESLIRIRSKEFEVIVVDQNKEIVLDEICKYYANFFPLTHVRVSFTGAAKARNYGATYAQGEILNFADDDCEYTENLLSKVIEYFENDKSLEILFGRAIDKKSKKTSVCKFYEKPSEVNVNNIYRTTAEFTMFIKRDTFNEIGKFDETFGVGTFYGSEEGADFVLRGLYLGKKMLYYPDLIFYHPQTEQTYNEKERIKAFNYAKGSGRLAFKHLKQYKNFNIFSHIAKSQFRCFCGMLIYLLLGKLNKSKFFYNIIKGRNIGFIYSMKEYSKEVRR